MIITKKDFNTILFGFSYIRNLEAVSEIDSRKITKQDSIINYLEEVLTIEDMKSARKDSIITNLESVVEKNEKARRKEKIKNTFTAIGLGILAGAEAGVITYLLIK